MKNKPVVLIIDDSPVNLTLLYSVLERHDFEVVLANSGERGFELAKKSPPDIILLDVIMSGWDGYDTCRHLKQDATLAKIPILFLSALGDTNNKVRALQAGGIDYISKPFQKEELLARVQTHVELAHLRYNLEREVATQTERIQLLFEALQLSYDKAQQASIIKTEFLRNVSHEFLTPMNIVLGMTEMLIEDTELTEEQQDYAEAVMKGGKQLMDILTNMLNFAQQFKGELQKVIRDVQVHEIVDNVLKKLSEDIQAKDIQIDTDIGPQLYKPLCGNQEGIEKVLSKLVDNAIKFTEKGKIMIRVQPLEECRDEKQWVQFEVSDTGIGIAADKQTCLFDIFSQVDGSSTRLYDGIGMGLAVAKMFIENMGGQIGVNSILDKGSTFWFYLPLEIPE
ncbi:response regulator [Candidatus Parabeggiatoa sp. HSG14]|uniref:ATP-binding response regulator n=1 Tax=Candidatus Parabeggiatoa sp. HSG14 TaxID=3055593 RepID=UPI0025A909D9|nr:response regulator [Thiotrichales bacterium HSG14]